MRKVVQPEMSAKKEYFVLNLLACVQKPYEKFIDPNMPSDLAEPSLDDLRKVLAGRGATNVVLVQMTVSIDVYFIFVDVDAARSDEEGMFSFFFSFFHSSHI